MRLVGIPLPKTSSVLVVTYSRSDGLGWDIK
jgi:hypothetical protein